MGTIVVGIDGSEAAKEALAWAVEEARLRGAKLHAVHAWSYPMTSPGFGMALPIDADTLQAIEENAVAFAREVGAGIDGTLDATVDAVQGAAAEVLLEAANTADLLVVGSRGHGGFGGLLLGSVSQQCAQHAHCPVVIVRAHTDG